MVLMEKERKERNRLVGGRKQLDFPRIVQKWESMGKNREKLLVRCLELRINQGSECWSETGYAVCGLFRAEVWPQTDDVYDEWI